MIPIWILDTNRKVNFDYLVIGGGGAGGSTVVNGSGAGGGGAGGFREDTVIGLNGQTSYTVTVGAGG